MPKSVHSGHFSLCECMWILPVSVCRHSTIVSGVSKLIQHEYTTKKLLNLGKTVPYTMQSLSLLSPSLACRKLHMVLPGVSGEMTL